MEESVDTLLQFKVAKETEDSMPANITSSQQHPNVGRMSGGGADARAKRISITEEETEGLRRISNLAIINPQLQILARDLVQRIEGSAVRGDGAIDFAAIQEAAATEGIKQQLEQAKAKAKAQLDFGVNRLIGSVEVSDEYALATLITELDPTLPDEAFYRLIRAIGACRARINLREVKSRYPGELTQMPTPPPSIFVQGTYANYDGDEQ